MAEEGDGGRGERDGRSADADRGGEPPIDPDTDFDAETAQVVMNHHGFLSWLGLEIEELETGHAVVTQPYRDELTNWVSKSLHGGVTATLIDTTSAFALRTTVDDPFGVQMATTDMTVKYVRPATSDLLVTAEVVRSGEGLGVTTVEVAGTAPDGERKTVAVGSTTYRLYRGGGQ
jgi:uncharacterized protein (TIGR00369 family)